jgi:RHS repeat-associated protein
VRDVYATSPIFSVVQSYNYDPYGNPTLAPATGPLTHFRYAGMLYHADSGLYLTQYRAYDPRTAKWLSRDPIGLAGGLNGYSYVGSNPISYFDLKGTQIPWSKIFPWLFNKGVIDPIFEHVDENFKNFIYQNLTQQLEASRLGQDQAELLSAILTDISYGAVEVFTDPLSVFGFLSTLEKDLEKKFKEIVNRHNTPPTGMQCPDPSSEILKQFLAPSPGLYTPVPTSPPPLISLPPKPFSPIPYIPAPAGPFLSS